MSYKYARHVRLPTLCDTGKVLVIRTFPTSELGTTSIGFGNPIFLVFDNSEFYPRALQ